MTAQTPLFRYEPPELGAGLISRPRLIQLLRRRFEERLMVLSAGVGFGKTVLLGQAIQENRLERFGRDVWLQTSELDRDPAHLLAGLYQSLTGRPTRSMVSTQDIVELVRQRGPEPVAFIVDDCHLLGSATGNSWRTVTSLLDQLPENGHVVFSGRSMPKIGIGRRQLQHPVVIIDQLRLDFDDDELHRFLASTNGDRGPLTAQARWPALAALSSSHGSPSPAEFIRDEILATLHPQQTRVLALLAPFSIIDDAIVMAVAGSSAWTARRLVEGLPLVTRRGEASYEIDPLWVEALAGKVDADQRRSALDRGSQVLLEQGAYVRAAQTAAAANDLDCVIDAIRRYCSQPMLEVDLQDVAELQAVLPDVVAAGPASLLLDGVRHWAASEHIAASIFSRTVDEALRAGDLEIEVLARWRLAQLQYLQDQEHLAVDQRLEYLEAQGVRLAAATAAFTRSVVAQRRGLVIEALAETQNFADFDYAQRKVAIAERLVDLGQPEQVTASIESVVGSGDVDIFGAQALWLRGEVAPELGWALAKDFPATVAERGIAHELVSVRSVVATVAISAGEFAAVPELIRDARQHESCVGDQVVLLVDIAEALHALCVDGEDRAAELLDAALKRVPLGRWPSRGHLHGLTALRALAPDQAAMLDDCDLGPALSTAVAAGAVLADLRSGEKTSGASTLPWGQPNVLRAHVPPPLLAELAVAAIADGIEEARQILIETPSVGTWLSRIARTTDGQQCATAGQLLAELPMDPGYRLSVRTLGELRIERSDGRDLGAAWHRRKRVQDLFVYLLTHPNATRRGAAAALWPDLPDAKAAANLRVNLTHLHAALEPDRLPGARPFFVDATATELRLMRGSIDVDTDAFDRYINQGTTAEADGVPTSAMEAYRAANELYVGTYLPEVDDDWVEPERLRLSSLAHSALCRTGELTLSRGEPEEAITAAVRAQRLDALSERAHRLSIRCHLALGSESSARAVAKTLTDRLITDGLSPDRETAQLLLRLDAGIGD